MSEQKFFCEEAVCTSDLMAAWLASGGAIEAQLGAHAAHSRQRGAGSDDGLAAGTPTTGGPECPGAWINEGLQARRYTTYGDCIDDELHAGGPTRYVFACIPIDDGLQAGGSVTHPLHGCADDGLQASAPTGLHPTCRGGL